jgi:two-component system NtrC family sensor kinase
MQKVFSPITNIFKNYFSSVENSISRRLLRSVLSIYFVLTLIVTSGHIVSEYYSAKDDVQETLVASGKTFHDILAADMWNYNYEQLSITAESMMRLPFITGIEVTVSEEVKPMFSRNKEEEGKAGDDSSFWHEFELNYMDSEKLHHIGKVRIYSDTSVVLNQIKSGLLILTINAIIKTIALLLLVTIVFNRLLTRPLGKLARHAESIDTENPEFKPIKVANNPKDELGQLQIAMNRMMEKTTDAIYNLDSLNKDLEKRVMARTSALRETVAELDKEKIILHNEVESRKKSELALSQSLAQLKQAQVKLVSSEKMASLGMLAAGIAHEINNPISFVLNNVSVLSEYNEVFHTLIKDYKSYAETALVVDDKAKEILERISQYEKEEDIGFIISDSLSLLESTEDGISRVVAIVKNMKTFSHPDAESEHSVDVHEVLDSTLLLLKNEIRTNVRVVKKLNAQAFVINCNRNQLGQVFLNLIMNAVQALSDSSDGIIQIRTENDEKSLSIHIMDNGCGISEDKIELIFDPFYTTKDVGEGTGMGLSISYGIVKKYNGSINVHSAPGKGTKFTLQFPLE